MSYSINPKTLPKNATRNPDISVILPTLRPDKTRKCIERITETSDGVNYEVVVVSPLNMRELLAGCKGYDRIKFVKEDKKEGSCKANTIGYENASGKYIFAIADDHFLGQDCLKNLLKFMQLHDSEIFLAGARCYGVYGAGAEHKAYGFYYAYNPCIRRDLVDKVGGFYDPYYKCYYGDPDLAMRVWHKGGKVELCLDAWVEFHNELDCLDLESHENNAERDFNAFFKRWHPIYGHLAKSSKEEDINVDNNKAAPGVPPEKCTRIVVFLRKKDWSALKRELESKDNILLNREYLFYVFKEAMNYIALAPINIQQKLSEWLVDQSFTQTSFKKPSEITVMLEPRKLQKTALNINSSDLILASIAMFFLNRGFKRDPELVVENYKGINIIYSSGKYYTWPCSFGGFSIDTFKKKSYKFAFCVNSIYEAIAQIDELMQDTPLVDWRKVREIEEDFNFCDFNLFQNDRHNYHKFDKIPKEICLKLIVYLRFKEWTGLERELDAATENTFIIRNHVCYVYDEALRNIYLAPPNVVLKLSQWFLTQLYTSSLYTGNEVQKSLSDKIIKRFSNKAAFSIKEAHRLTKIILGRNPNKTISNDIKEILRLIGIPQHSFFYRKIIKVWNYIQMDRKYDSEIKDQVTDVRLVLEGYRQYNIVHCNGLYYGWPWSAGGFTLDRYTKGIAPAAVIGKSILEVKKLIDAKLGTPTPEEENKHNWIATQQIEAACENERTCLENIKNGSSIIDNYPVVLIASVAFGCNIRCKMCYLQSDHELSYEGSYGRREMSDATFSEIIKLFPKVQNAIMTVEGEILVHKKWFHRWQKATEPYPNIKLSFQTNGMLMNEDVVEEVLNDPRIIHIAFSIDGATPAVNDSIRHGAKLDRVLNNISMLIKAKKELKRDLPNIHTHFVMMRDNIHELPAYVKKMIEIGVNSISARHLIVYHKEQIKQSLYFHQDLCDEMILKAREVAKSFGISVDLPQTFSEAKKQNQITRPKCFDPWRHGQILHDGGIYSCCNNAVLMGNINDGGFENVWNNEKYQRLRATVNSKDPEFTLCKYCNAMLPVNCFEAHIYTKLLFKLIENNELYKWCPKPVELLIKPGEVIVE